MRVRSTAGLHRCNLLWILDVGNIEDSYAAKTSLLGCRDVMLRLFLLVCILGRAFVLSFFLALSLVFIFSFIFILIRRRRFRGKSLHAAIQTSIRHLYGHEQQILVYRYIPLS